MTRSLEKAAADGAVIDKPGGGPFLRDEVDGVLWGTPNCADSAPGAVPGASIGGLTPFCRASMI